MLFPVRHIFLDQGLVKANYTLEQINCLLTIIDLCGRELVNRCVVRLKLACLKEWYGVLHERHSRKLGQVFVIIE